MEADPKRPYKALVAFVLSFIVALSAAVAGKTDLDTMGWQGWLVVVLGALATAAATYLVRNPKVGEA
jgi:hypothetical protein